MRVLWVRVQRVLRVLLGVAIIAVGASTWMVEASAAVRISGFLLVGLGLGVVLGNV